MDRLELKVRSSKPDNYLRSVRRIKSINKEQNPKRSAKHYNASKERRTVEADKQTQKSIEARQKKWSKEQNQHPSAKNKGSKYTSNKNPLQSHRSRCSNKCQAWRSNRAKLLYINGGIDSDYQLMTATQSAYAHQKDNICLQRLTEQIIKNLFQKGIEVENLLADADYSSDENYRWLEERGIKSYIPHMGLIKEDQRTSPISKKLNTGNAQRKACHIEKITSRKKNVIRYLSKQTK